MTGWLERKGKRKQGEYQGLNKFPSASPISRRAGDDEEDLLPSSYLCTLFFLFRCHHSSKYPIWSYFYIFSPTERPARGCWGFLLAPWYTVCHAKNEICGSKSSLHVRYFYYSSYTLVGFQNILFHPYSPFRVCTTTTITPPSPSSSPCFPSILSQIVQSTPHR